MASRNRNRKRRAAPASRRRRSGYDYDARPPATEVVGRWLYRHRWELAPVHAGLAAAVLATFGHLVWGLGWTLAGDVVAGLAVASWCRWRLSGDDRWYAAGAAGGLATWITAVTWVGWNQWTLGAWVLGVAGIGAAWWPHRAVRARIELQREQDRWPAIAEAIGLAGSRIRKIVKRGPFSEVRHLSLRRGHQTVDSLNVKRLESAMGLPPGAVKAVERHKKDSSVLIVHITRQSPWADDDVEQPHPALAVMSTVRTALQQAAEQAAAVKKGDDADGLTVG